MLLRNIVAAVRDDPYPEILLAVQYLLTDRFDLVNPILKRMRYSNPDYPPFVQLELFIFLKAAVDRDSALSMYLDALRRFPADSYIRRGVKRLREEKDFPGYQKRVSLRELVRVTAPRKHTSRRAGGVQGGSFRRWRNIALAMVLVSAAATLVLLAGYKYFRQDGNGSGSVGGGVSDIDMIVLDKSRYGLVETINRQREPVFYYSSDEVLKDFNEVRSLLKQEKHNEALKLVNRLLHSNATPGVKERAGFLKRFILDNDERAVSAVTYRELAREPYLYEGMLVSWRGRVANVKRKQGRLTFTLMVEYREHDVFSGIADVYGEREFSGIENGNILTVEALYVASQGKDGRAYLLLKEARQ